MNKKVKRTVIFTALIIAGCIYFCLSPVRDRFSGLRPEDQNNTTWVSEQPKIIMEVNNYARHCCSGKIFLKDTVNAAFFFDSGTSVLVDDTDKIVYRTESDGQRGMNDSNAMLFWGRCDFSSDRCIIEVTRSNTDEIKVGNEIILNRQERYD